MKTIGKKLVGFCMVLVFAMGMLVGCGGTNTPAGTLEATLSAMKNGDLKKLGELAGEDFSQGDWQGIPAGEVQRFFRAVFGNISVQVREKESDDTSAVVTVSGETGDLFSVMSVVGKEVSSEFTQWCEDNAERLLEISSEEMRGQMMKIMASSFEKHKEEMTRKPVDFEIKMSKDSDGKWIVDPDSADDMATVVFGTEGIPSMGSLLESISE